jgi:hypothetical protein
VIRNRKEQLALNLRYKSTEYRVKAGVVRVISKRLNRTSYLRNLLGLWSLQMELRLIILNQESNSNLLVFTHLATYLNSGCPPISRLLLIRLLLVIVKEALPLWINKKITSAEAPICNRVTFLSRAMTTTRKITSIIINTRFSTSRSSINSLSAFW